ncbi:MAG: protease modulator HflC [Verrucomicrobiae bacterium]|nr:protease modulator HflC [Verrucomicrobiae bacterium]MCX7722008.1 protease modulator HflC [Verrucomicrobiae bacterium]MDW7980903.1 protease modulator HflC [Verrucomicrobiales bacterium]
MKRSPLSIAIGILLLVIFFLLLFTFQVRQSEVAVVTTFGKPKRPVDKPGPYLKLPWPIQKVYKFDQRMQNFEDDRFDEVLTADNFNLLAMVYAGWRIKDPMAFFTKFAGGSVTEAEKALRSLIRTAKSAVIGRHPLAHLISANEAESKFTQIENEIAELVRAQVAANNYGIEIEFIGFKKLGLPESVTTEVFNRMQSERQVLISKFQHEGEAEAAKIKSEADRKAAELLAVAEAEATRIRGLGEAEAAKSLATFQQHPDLANFMFRLSALEASLKERATLILDQQTPPFDLLGRIQTNQVTK